MNTEEYNEIPEEENNIPSSEEPTSNEEINETEETSAVYNTESLLNDEQRLNLSELHQSVNAIKKELEKIIVGQKGMIDLLMIALFTDNHVLLEGMPGVAKTLTSKLLSKTLDALFSRIQFTPDLMPTDVIGTSVFNMKTNEFEFKAGPIFSNIILIDEINRSPAKTQAALMEVMEERQITTDGLTYEMDFPFMVIATQNPVEQEGTYQLPEAQLDRFIFKIKVDYPELEDEIEILSRMESDFSMQQTENLGIVLTKETLKNCRNLIEKIYIKKDLIKYIAQIVDLTRNNHDLYLGASPRASINILKASKAIAALRGRDFVTPDDVQFVAKPVLNHRLILSPEKEMEGVTVEQVVDNIIARIEVPR